MAATSVAALRDIATQLRIDSVASTSKAGSGHPTTCLSAADIMAVLFFAEMHFDPKNPQDPDNDRFVLSKGHAAPILYAAWAEAGLFPRERLMELRTFESDLEGHPTPRLPFVDVATGSLGQGICAAVGIALNARRIGSGYRTYVLLGDGEIAEGSVWEAADSAVALQARQPLRDRRRQRARPEPAHRVPPRPRSHRRALERVRLEGHRRRRPRHRRHPGRAWRPRAPPPDSRRCWSRARSRARDSSAIEGKEAWHGKALKSGEETDKAIKELEGQLTNTKPEAPIPGPRKPRPRRVGGRLRHAAGARLQARRSGRHPRGLGHRARHRRQARPPHRRARRRRQELDLQRSLREGRAGSLLRDVHRRAGDGRRGDGLRRARRDPVPVDVRLLPLPRRGLHPHGRHLDAERQAHRLARRRVDWRGRAVADGARGPRHDAGDSRARSCSIPAMRSAPSGWSPRWRSTRGSPTCARRGRRRRSPTGRRSRSRSAARKSCGRARTTSALVVGAGITVFEALKAYDLLKAEGIVDPRHRCLLGPADRQGDADQRRARRPAAWSSPSRTTIRPADLATRWPKRWRDSRDRGRTARGPRDSRAADSPTSWWTSSASRRGTSSTP